MRQSQYAVICILSTTEDEEMIQYSLNLKSEVTVGAIVEFVLTDFNFINQNLNLGLVVKLILIPKFIDHFIHKNIKNTFLIFGK